MIQFYLYYIFFPFIIGRINYFQIFHFIFESPPNCSILLSLIFLLICKRRLFKHFYCFPGSTYLEIVNPDEYNNYSNRNIHYQYSYAYGDYNKYVEGIDTIKKEHIKKKIKNNNKPKILSKIKRIFDIE